MSGWKARVHGGYKWRVLGDAPGHEFCAMSVAVFGLHKAMNGIPEACRVEVMDPHGQVSNWLVETDEDGAVSVRADEQVGDK